MTISLNYTPYDYTVQPEEPESWAEYFEYGAQLLKEQGHTEHEIHLIQMPELKALREADATRALEEFQDAQEHLEELGIIENKDPVWAAIERRVERLDLAALLLEDDEPIEWVWGDGEQGYIEAASVGCFHGFGGTGKSMVAQALARAVTSGTELLEMPCKQGRVLIIDAENPRREVKRRVKRLGLDPERTRYLRTKSPILEHGFAAWLQAEIGKHQATLLILDSQRGLWAGDEKEAAEIRLFYTELRNVGEATGCAIIVIHHDNKSLTFSGSTDIDAAADTRIHMTRDQKDESVRYLKHAKMRGAPENKTIEVQIRFEGMRLFVEKGDRQPGEQDVPKRKATAEEIAMWIRQQERQEGRPGAIRDEFNMSSATLRARRDELADLGIRFQEAGAMSVYYATPKPRTSGELPG